VSVIIDFPKYLTPLRVSTASSIILVRRLINAAPKPLSGPEKQALRELRAAGVKVQEIASARERARPENLTPEDRRFDGYWGLLRDQIVGWLRIEGEPEYALAERFVKLLFAKGITFVTLSYEEEWFESDKRLKLIDDGDLEGDLVKLVHPNVLPKLRTAHAALGEGLGVGDTYVEPPDGQALIEALRQLSLAVAKYARILAGTVEVDDPTSTARFLSAMAPVDQHRATYGTPPSQPVDTEAPTAQPVAPDPDEPGPDAPLPPVE
jgi:hypothetical protein